MLRASMKKFSKRKTKELTQELDKSMDEIHVLLQKKKKKIIKRKQEKFDASLLDLLRKTSF